MTYSEFATIVAGFINRTDLTTMILNCANMSKEYAQRKHNFKMARGRAFLSPTVDGVELSTAKDAPGGSAVVVKKVESAWFYETSGSNYRKTSRIPFMTLGDGKNFYDVRGADWAPAAGEISAVPSENRIFIQGTKIFLLSATTAQPVMLDCVLKLTTYTGSNTDFFLDHHSDWLIAKTLDFLNMYLKDDQRLLISGQRLEDSWASVIAFDEDYAEGQMDVNSGD